MRYFQMYLVILTKYGKIYLLERYSIRIKISVIICGNQVIAIMEVEEV